MAADQKLSDQNQSGVASLLADESRVLFQSIFDTKQIGRITDLLVAELEEAALDEFRLRVVLLVTVCLLREYEQAGVPLTLECGADSDWIAVGLEFQAPSALIEQFSGLHDRLLEKKPASLFDEGLQLLFSAASRLYVRRFGGTGRVEVISMIPRHAVVQDAPVLRDASAEFALLNLGDQTERKNPGVFIELGDLNYTALLSAKADAKGGGAKTAGEALARLGGGVARDEQALVRGVPEDEETGSSRIRGISEEDSGQTRVKGSGQESEKSRRLGGRDVQEEEVRIQGVTERDDSCETRLKAGGEGLDSEQTRIRGVTDRDDSSEVRLKGSGAEAQDETRIGGTTEFTEDRVRVRGTTEKIGEGSSDVTVVSGSGDTRASSWGKGTGSAFGGASDGSPEEVSALQERIRSLERQLELSRRAGAGVPFSGSRTVVSGRNFEDQNEDVFQVRGEGAPEHEPRGVKRLLKKLWPFGKGGSESSEAAKAQGLPPLLETGTASAPGGTAIDPQTVQFAVESGATVNQGTEGESTVTGAASSDPVAPTGAAAPEPEQSPETVAAKLLAEIDQGQIQKTISRAREEADDLKSEEENPRLKRWADRLVGELLTEKARLFAMAKKLNQSIKQKELDFQRKEHTLQRELAKTEEQLRQKSAAMEHLKTQLAQSLTNAAKQSGRGSAALPTEDAQMKQKLMQASRSNQVLKDENKSLNDKVTELQAKVSGLQAAVKTKSSGDAGPVQARLDRALKTVEEFKRSNQVLMERLAEADKRGSAGGGEENSTELRQKLDTAMRVATLKKKEAQKLSTKVEEMLREETRLRMEVAKLQLEVKQARAGASPKPGTNPSASSTQKKAG